MAVSRMVGARVRRKEDPRLITGAGTYVDDVRRVDMAYLELVRSPYAHACINSIDVSAAREMDGVIDVFVWDDIKDDIGPIPLDAAPSPDMLKPPRQALASGKARMLGDAVAAVVAEDRYVARDAAEAVEVDYEPLDAVVDVEAAIEEGAPLIWEDLGSNMAFRIEPGSENIDEALAEADNVFSFRYVNQRLIPNPMETRGVVVEPVGGGGLTMWSSTQIPHMLKDRLAAALRIPSNQIRVIAPEVGGGFGCKLNVYPEEYCTALAALRSNRPVKWIEDRSESFLATTHGRGQVNYIDVGVNDDGKVLAIKTKIIADLGAYYQILTAAVPTLSQLMMTGPYDIQAASSELICVFTNKSPTDAYRGAGRPEATYFLERALDQTAQKLDMDPAELRRKNLIPADQFPYAAPSGVEYDSGDHVTALDKAMEAIDYQGFRGRQAAALEEGRYLGIGVSSYTEICGFGPSNTLGHGLLGERHGQGGPGGQGHGSHRSFAARTGTGNELRADRCRRPGRPLRRRDRPPRRHDHRSVWRRNLRKPRHRRGRDRLAHVYGQGNREGQARSESPAGSGAGRHGLPERSGRTYAARRASERRSRKSPRRPTSSRTCRVESVSSRAWKPRASTIRTRIHSPLALTSRPSR